MSETGKMLMRMVWNGQRRRLSKHEIRQLRILASLIIAGAYYG